MWRFLLLLAAIGADTGFSHPPPPHRSPECSGVCPAIYQPICASCADGLESTFQNECQLRRLNACHEGAGCTKVRDGECQKRCEVLCPEIYQPVCALCNGEQETTFGNDCELERRNTCQPNNQCAKLHAGYCGVDEPSDPIPIDPILVPFELTPLKPGPSIPTHHVPKPSIPRRSKPESPIHASYIPEPYRPRAPGPRSTCPVACPAIYQPVCAECHGVGETTFGNICELEASNVCHPQHQCTKLRSGECEPVVWGPLNRSEQECNIFCPSLVYQPVCADCPGTGPRTFQSDCDLKAFNACNPDPCNKLRDGECEPSADNEGSGLLPPESRLYGSWPLSPQPPNPWLTGYRSPGPRVPGPKAPGLRPSGPRISGPGISCPIACPLNYQPVCARFPDGSEKTFGNACQLQAQNSCDPLNQCTQIYEGECRDTNPVEPDQCPDVCTEEYKPVCAQCPTGKQTFSNACALRQHCCQTGEECVLLQDGACEGCIKPCPLYEAPFCAICKDNRYRTFPNSCLMENYNCQNHDSCRNVSQPGIGNTCPPQLPGHVVGPPSSQCDRLCPAIYQPVCARCNQKTITFENSCAYDTYNCKNNYECKKIQNSECPPCPQLRCSSERSPICAECGPERRTFDNECLFNAYNCPSGYEWTKLFNGTCEAESSSVCPAGCTREYAPVCAQCANGQRTFSNRCVLQQNNCQSRPGCTYLRDGECGSSCDKICPLYDIQICARCANNVYRTFPNTCIMDNHNCRTNENCRYVSQGGVCPAVPVPPRHNPPNFPTDPAVCAAIDCSPVRAPVCARCGPTQALRTFTNGCELDIHNCFHNQECAKIREGACTVKPEPVICPTQHAPVCASCTNGPRTFPNRCFLNSYQILNPQENCTQIYQGQCRTACPQFLCLDVKKPICALCGFEERTFDNECVFNSYNCPAGYVCAKIRDGPCSSVPPLICTGEYQPVCATCSTGLETFANQCFLNAHNLANPEARCLPRNEGSCVDAPVCPQLKCSSKSDPVCGLCGYQKITFVNDCQFSSYNCTNKYACRVLHSGSCE